MLDKIVPIPHSRGRLLFNNIEKFSMLRLPPGLFPQSTGLHFNQDYHRRNRANTALFLSQMVSPEILSRERDAAANSRREDLQTNAQNASWNHKQEQNAIYNTYTILSMLAHQQTSSSIQQKKRRFNFHIHRVEYQKVDQEISPVVIVSLDCSKSTNLNEINKIIKDVKNQSNRKKIFTVESCRISEPMLIEKLIQDALNEIAEDPRTQPQTKNFIEEGHPLVNIGITDSFQNRQDKEGVRWEVSLKLTSLKADEIQYLLWKIIRLKEYGSLFIIKGLHLSDNAIELKRLATSEQPNLVYPEVKGKLIGQFLHNSITDLRLDHWKIGQAIVPYLAQYYNLETLLMDFSIQKKQDLVNLNDIRKACPKLRLLELK